MLRCASVSGAPTYKQYACAPETSRALPDGFIRSRRGSWCFWGFQKRIVGLYENVARFFKTFSFFVVAARP
jgi:hypothetical protein